MLGQMTQWLQAPPPQAPPPIPPSPTLPVLNLASLAVQKPSSTTVTSTAPTTETTTTAPSVQAQAAPAAHLGATGVVAQPYQYNGLTGGGSYGGYGAGIYTPQAQPTDNTYYNQYGGTGVLSPLLGATNHQYNNGIDMGPQTQGYIPQVGPGGPDEQGNWITSPAPPLNIPQMWPSGSVSSAPTSSPTSSMPLGGMYGGMTLADAMNDPNTSFGGNMSGSSAPDPFAYYQPQ